MVGSLRGLLNGVIDYAGLFPPASLSPPEAWRKYAEYVQGPECWMISAFVCPAAKFEALADLAAETPGREPWSVSLLAGGTTTRQECGPSWEREVLGVARRLPPEGAPPALARHVSLASAELKLPDNAFQDLPNLEYLLAELLVAWDLTRHAPSARVFFEMPRVEPWERMVVELANAVDRLPSEQRLAAGLKLRTGGTEAAAFPSSREVAAFLIACRDYDLAWKATAGLHHPLRHDSQSSGCKMHGFVNLLAAAVLAEAHAMEIDEVVEILDDESAASFHFDEDQLAWHDLTAPLAMIRHVRQRRLISIGSCSVDEPLDDLRRLGWL